MSWKKRLLACLLAAVLAVGALSAGGEAVSAADIYIMAENDQMLDLPLEAMPTWIDGVLYVPYHAFDWSYTRVNLGVSYGQEQNGSRYLFTLYSLNGTLVFDVNAGTCAESPSGLDMDMKAVVRGSRVFVPLAGVCRYFGLQYSYTPTNYGTLIRITNGQEVMNTARFVEAASGSSMRSRYNEYIRQINAAASASPTPSQGGTASPEPTRPDGRRLTVSLAFQCAGDGAEALLDALEGTGVRALFLFAPEALADNEGAVRRAVGSGHTVGLTVSGATAGELLAQAEAGAAWLEERLFLRPHIVHVEGGDGETADTLGEAGWAWWVTDVDGRDDGRGQSAQRVALMTALDSRRGRVNVLLDDSAAVTGYLSRALGQMAQEGYTFRQPVETDL